MNSTSVQRMRARKRRLRRPSRAVKPKPCGVLCIVLVCFFSLAKNSQGFDRKTCIGSLGMESGEIEDKQISASSTFDSTVGAIHSRLNRSRAGGAWCPKPQITSGVREYLEIDFLDVKVITQIATQGRNDKGRGQEYMEEYTIEYYRPKLGRWKEYQRWDGKKLLTGNSDTKTIVYTRLEPAIIANKIRVLPHSLHWRSICTRVDFYGCVDDSGLISYTVPPSHDITADLNDTTYDGTVLNDGTLVDGLGRLADGQVGADSFTLDFGQGKGSGWVAWKSSSFPKKCVELLFEFNTIRNFSQINIYANNFFSKRSQIFGRAVVYFHVDGMLYLTDPVVFHPRADLQSERARNITINIRGGAIAKMVKIKLYFVRQWIMIGEVYFTSEPVLTNISTTSLKLMVEDDDKPPKFDEYGNILNDGDAVSDPYNVYSYIHLSISMALLFLAITALFLFFFFVRGSESEPTALNTRGYLSRQRIQEWFVHWSSRGNDEAVNDPENAESVVKLEPVNPSEAIEQYYEQTYSKQAQTQLTANGYVTTIISETVPKRSDQLTVECDAQISQYNMKFNSLQSQIKNVLERPKVRTSYINKLFNNHANNDKNCGNKFMNSIQNLSDSQELVSCAETNYQSVSLDSMDDNGGFEEYKNSIALKEKNTKSGRYTQKDLPDKIEHLLLHVRALSVMDKVQFGPEYLWNIGASDIAPKIYPQGELVPIPLSGLTQHKQFCSYLDREIYICSTEKLRKTMTNAPPMVAVRMAKLQKNEDCVEYFQEVRLLASLNHPGLCNVIGIVTSKIPPLIVQEFTPGEDLCNFLRSSKQTMTFSTMLYIITQICCSMRYLESLFTVHRDLAARNCLVYPNNHIKVTDLAMYSNAYESDYFHTGSGRRLPIRWMSWEAILLGRTTCSSTVWSFAITVWEIFEHCSIRPFADLNDSDLLSMFEVLFYEGHTLGNYQIIDALPKPQKCPIELYKMLKRCWNRFEEDRPTFDELYNFLMHHFHEELPFEYLL